MQEDSKCSAVDAECTLGVQPSAFWDDKRVESLRVAAVTSPG